jgi:GH24 family phage-related lysozyme (muramidase)
MSQITSNEDALLNAADDFLIEHEKFRDKAYQIKMKDGTLGNPTIGYGFEFYGDEQTRVQMGETITKNEARPLLRQKTNAIHNFLKKYPTYNEMSDREKVGIISFAFNNGVNVFDDPVNPNIRGALDSGNMNDIQYWMRQFNKGENMQPMIGLMNRREAEIKFMNDPTKLFNPFGETVNVNPTSASETTTP